MKVEPRLGIVSSLVLPENELENDFIIEQRSMIQRRIGREFVGKPDTPEVRKMMVNSLILLLEEWVRRLGLTEEMIEEKKNKKLSKKDWVKS